MATVSMKEFGPNRRGRDCLLAVAILFFLLSSCPTGAVRVGAKNKARVFLQKQLPLRLIVTTPTELAGSGSSTFLSGRQPLTAVFSRPVIALGSDFGQSSTQQQKLSPFSLSCSSGEQQQAAPPGKLRWVTTSIARFDPDVDWPTDLNCTLSWDTKLTTYDGAPLDLGSTARRRPLCSNPLSMWLIDVLSDKALNLTDGLWGADVNGQYEVPPDGKLLLQFNHPVNLQMLQSALKLVEAGKPNGPGLDFDVAPCQSPAHQWPYPRVESDDAAATTTSPSVLPLDLNTTCAQVTPTDQLIPDGTYTLLLPRLSRYHALAGRLQTELNAAFYGLRPFRLPFVDSSSFSSTVYGTRYRRLDVWLPHGLSPETSPNALAQRITLCQLRSDTDCSPTPFTFSLVSRGKARLSVPSLQPRTQYRISVAADPRVKDGFDQGLMASSLTFWTSAVDYAFAAPSINTGVTILEAGADTLESWPFITRGVGPRAYYYTGDVIRSIRAWDINLADDKVKALLAKILTQYNYVSGDLTPLGLPTRTLDVPSELLSTAPEAPDWTQLLLPLRSSSSSSSSPLRALFVTYKPTEIQGALYGKLLLNSSLSFNVIKSGRNLTAWVLDASAGGGGPEAGAAVTVFSKSWGYGTDPTLLASCVTDSSGLCAMTLSVNNSISLIAFAVAAGGQIAVLEDAGFVTAATPPQEFVGTLVADRLVVVPGDSVKITGFVQRVTSSGDLQLPPDSYAALLVSPNWNAAAAAATAAGGVSSAGGRRLLAGAADTVSLTAAAATIGNAGLGVATRLLVDVNAVQPVVDKRNSDRSRVSFLQASSAAGSSSASASSSVASVAAIPIVINGTTGTFRAEIVVPKGARFQPYTLQLSVPSPGTRNAALTLPKPAEGSSELYGWPTLYGAALTITVADPRPPTADLKLSTPAWSHPTSLVSFTATTVSYIGASVTGASLTATWRTARASGLLQLTTDSRGWAEGDIDLGALPPANRSEPYDNLSIDVEWIGPTRERITRSASVILADGPARLDLQLSLTPSTPGTAFSLAATLTSNDDGTTLIGIPVTATLRPNDTTNTTTTPGCPPPSSSSCALTSGSPFSSLCQMALPCVGHFLLEACAEVAMKEGAWGQTKMTGTVIGSNSSNSSSGTGTGTETTQRVCSRQVLGRNASEWALRPLQGHPEPMLFTDKTSYAQGDMVKLQLQNPWPGARLLMQWGNPRKSRTKVLSSLSSGLEEVTLGPLGDEVRGGGSIIAVLDVPRLTAEQMPEQQQMPVSRLFDPRAPHSHVLSATLNVRPDNALAVSVAVETAAAAADGGGGGIVRTIRDVDGKEVVAVEPGTTAQVVVTVKDSLQADAASPAADSVEVTVYGVDKAFLDLLPYDLPHPEQEMVLRLAADMNAYGISAYRLAPGAVRAVFDKVMARLTGLDPWLPTDTRVQSLSWSADTVDVDDATYLARFSTALTTMPSVPWYYFLPGGVARPEATPSVTAESALASGSSNDIAAKDDSSSSNGSSSSASSSGSSSSVAVRYESNFAVTPLFATATADGDGRARVTFTAPQNLGTFVLRAFAASGSSALYGSGEGKVAVRRQLSLTPSLPRFARVGDVFEAGVLVTVGSAPAAVTVALQLDGGGSSSRGSSSGAVVVLSVSGPLSKLVSFATAADGLQKEVRFSFFASAIGTANLTFTAREEGEGEAAAAAADALQVQLSVTGQQGDVWVATSFAITATHPAGDANVVQWQEGLALPAAVPGSGGLNLTAGVGYFPAIAALYDKLQQNDADRSYASAVPAVLWATVPAVLSYYGQPITARQSELAADGLEDLAQLTSTSGLGLQWSDPGRWYGWRPTRTDLGLNTWALFLAALHGSTMMSSSLATRWSSLESTQLPQWRAAVARQLVADAMESRHQSYNPGPYSDWNTLSWARLALGAEWAPQDASAQIRNDLSLASLINANNSMSRAARVQTCLVLQSLGPTDNPAPSMVTSTVNELTSALRVQGRTAYVAVAPGVASAAPLEDQALSLLLLLRAGVNHQLLPKLAAYVADPASTGGYGIFSMSYSWREQGLAVAALSEYDKTRGSSKPNVTLRADANGLTVLQATFQAGGSTRPVSNVTVWEDIPAAATAAQGGVSELNFQVSGSGEVTVAASLHFVPVQLLTFPTYRGLFVEAALQLVDPSTGGPTGLRVSSVPLGALVTVTLQLTSPDDVGPVTLAVLMPAGLEPLDPNTAAGGAGGAPLGLSCGANWVENWGSFSRRWWWPRCPSQETRPWLVTFSYLSLPAGTSSVYLRAVAATPGTFVFPPVRAEADNQPELMGMTAATSITVCAECNQATFVIQPQPTLVACPNDCSGNGACNLKTGICTCRPGFGRADCSRPVRA